MLVGARTRACPTTARSACRSSGTAAAPGRAACPRCLGEHTADVLTKLGYDAAAIKDLGDRHVVQL